MPPRGARAPQLPCRVGPAEPARASRMWDPRDERISGGRAAFCASMLGRDVLPKVNYLPASGSTRAYVSFRIRGALSDSPPWPCSCQASCEALGLLLLNIVQFTMLHSPHRAGSTRASINVALLFKKKFRFRSDPRLTTLPKVAGSTYTMCYV